MLRPSKCEAFIIICCNMRNTHNTATTSLKGLVRCKTATDETGVPVDSQTLEECRQMLVIMNCLMCRQLSDLKRRQMVQIASREAEQEMNAIRPSRFRKVANG